ncbi:MAG: hypothetical protein MUC37_08280 [Hyphomicrobium sp.]|jgi:hypothetical protein|nr:hypothetical protein [Hyphomicrobium sp.]
MQRAGENRGELGDEPLALDLQRLIRQVAVWASARPIILNVALFGDRVRFNPNPAVLELAVRFDETRMVEGFDDWIEQLRTNFSELEALIGEKIAVTTPDNSAMCRRVFAGRDLEALAIGKVRVMMPVSDQTHVVDDAALHNANRTHARQWPFLAAALDWFSPRSAGAH